MASPTEKQLDYMLRLANQLTGERARYLSQSSILPKSVKTSAEASRLIDDLQAAIEEHEKWQQETGLTIGAVLRHHYTTSKGVKIIAEGPVTAYKWGRDLAVAELVYNATPATRQAAGFGPDVKTAIALDRLGERAADDPVAELEAERGKLLARLAEIDAELAKLRA